MSTVAEPIRFRCFQCNKLLGVSRSKAGAVVACPQCSAELVVPEAAATASPTPSPDPMPTETPKSSPSSSRIEPVVVLWDATPSSEGSSDVDPAFPAVQFEPVSLRAEPAARSRPAPRAAKSSSRDDGQAVDVDVAAAIMLPRAVIASPPAEPGMIPTLVVTYESPSLRDEPAHRGDPARISPRERSVKRDDVVFPRTALILWSFVVLLALVSAFAAGLLAGRFLWARGVAVGGQKPVAVHRQSMSGREYPIAWSGGGEV